MGISLSMNRVVLWLVELGSRLLRWIRSRRMWVRIIWPLVRCSKASWLTDTLTTPCSSSVSFLRQWYRQSTKDGFDCRSSDCTRSKGDPWVDLCFSNPLSGLFGSSFPSPQSFWSPAEEKHWPYPNASKQESIISGQFQPFNFIRGPWWCVITMQRWN